MKRKISSCSALIAAAGNGSRMHVGMDKSLENVNKMFFEIAGAPVLAHTLSAFERCSFVDEIIVTTREQDIPLVKAIADDFSITKLKTICVGGATRQESVRKGLMLVGDASKLVAIHDGARCLITPEQIGAVIMAADEYGAAALGTKMSDSVKRVDESGRICDTVDREGLYTIQTPQVFYTDEIRRAHDMALEKGLSVTDDCAVAEAAGIPIKVVEVSKTNFKMTTPPDIEIAELILGNR